MTIQKAVVPLDVTVRFAETDAMSVVHHSNYIVWFEAGRIAWLDAASMPYAQIAAGGHHFAVTNVNVEYREATRFGDDVRVDTWLTELRSRKVSFAYEVRAVRDERLLVHGTSQHICVDLAGKMAKIPAPVIARLEAGIARLAGMDAL